MQIWFAAAVLNSIALTCSFHSLGVGLYVTTEFLAQHMCVPVDAVLVLYIFSSRPSA